MDSESQGSFLRHYLDPYHQPPKHPYSTPSARGGTFVGRLQAKAECHGQGQLPA